MKKIIAASLAALLAATPISAAALKVDNNAEIPKLVLDGTWENPFLDVAVGDWFYDGVMFAYGKGMMNGVGDGAFAPSATLTRAMMITVLYRNAGSPQASGRTVFGCRRGKLVCRRGCMGQRKQGCFGNGRRGAFSRRRKSRASSSPLCFTTMQS